MKINRLDIGQEVRKKVEESGMSKAKFAELLGIAQCRCRSIRRMGLARSLCNRCVSRGLSAGICFLLKIPYL